MEKETPLPLLDRRYAMNVLLFILDNPGCIQQSMRDVIVKNNNTLGRVIGDLQEDGLVSYIEETEYPGARKRKLSIRLYLTSRGTKIAILRKLQEEIEQHAEYSLDMSPRERYGDRIDVWMSNAVEPLVDIEDGKYPGYAGARFRR